jgi:HD-GYP domain-containing protein (c-di-GMP phosphodiesterase class II)
MLASRAAAAIDNAVLYSNLQQTFRQTIQGLARALEAMDKYTAGHSDRVTVYARITAEAMGESIERVEMITQAGMLHDIGKLGCHANLNKPGKLTEEEYEIFKLHPTFGKEILEPIAFLQPLIPGIHSHHERWDGKGYPLGLQGEEIPIMARILSVADAYDAMTSSRAYRRALEHSVAVAELKRCSGTQFDPSIVEAFLNGIESYRTECSNQGIPIPD